MDTTTTPRGKVLVIDDNETVLDATRAVLEAEGFEVLSTKTVWCANLILSEKPDLILLDVKLSGIQGDQAARAFSQVPMFLNQARTTIVFHSCLPVDELEVKVRETGVAGYIQKADDPRILVEQVVRWIEFARSRPPGT